MRRILALGLLLSFAPAFAEAPRPDPVVILKKDVPLRTVYAWERWGNFLNAVPGDGQEIPYDAAKLQVRVYTFRAGEIRVITFNKGVRTHDHVNMTDTIDYTWTGRRVVIANGQASITGPGDASFHPKGVFHHGEALESGFGLEFAMQTQQVWPDPQVTWAPASSRPMEAAATWTDHGVVHEVYGPAARSVPEGAAHFEARSFDFSPSYTLREIHLPGGTRLPMKGSRDRLILLLSGTASVGSGGQVWQIEAEDAVNASSTGLTTWSTTSECILVVADVPPRPAALEKSATASEHK